MTDHCTAISITVTALIPTNCIIVFLFFLGLPNERREREEGVDEVCPGESEREKIKMINWVVKEPKMQW